MRVDLLKLCDDIDLDIGDLVAKDGRRGVAHKKQAIYYRLRIGYGMSWHEIADLCHKDHTTIIHNFKVFENIMNLVNLTKVLVE